MTGWRVIPGDAKMLALLRRIDPGVGQEGVLLQSGDLNKWLERMESWGSGLEFRIESSEMTEAEFYGLNADVLASLGILAPGAEVR
jgi:hypothetical protein